MVELMAHKHVMIVTPLQTMDAVVLAQYRRVLHACFLEFLVLQLLNLMRILPQPVSEVQLISLILLLV